MDCFRQHWLSTPLGLHTCMNWNSAARTLHGQILRVRFAWWNPAFSNLTLSFLSYLPSPCYNIIFFYKKSLRDRRIYHYRNWSLNSLTTISQFNTLNISPPPRRCCGLEGPEMNNTKRCKFYNSIYLLKYRQ